LAVLAVRVYDGQEECVSDRADSVPTLLSLLDAFHEQHTVRIGEHEKRRFKWNAVLPLVSLVLVFVPLESQIFIVRNFRIAVNGKRTLGS
jgi:hypothetical protein